MKNKTEIFIEKARSIHGNKYDYSKVEYINNKTKVCIICPTHGEFLQQPNSHLSNHGCPLCKGDRIRGLYTKTKEKFIEEASLKHSNVYDYSKVDYVNGKTKVRIICQIHGEFLQTPEHHLNGEGCPMCAVEKCSKINLSNTEEFIEKARAIHGDKYDYSKVEYINNKTRVCIICPTHGEFWQTPDNHLQGKGCPICKSSKLENEIKNLLESNNIEYIREFKLDRQRIDFLIPSKNIAIECQGEQHFIPKFPNGFEEGIESDIRKFKKCNENGFKVIYYTNKRNIPTDLNYEAYGDIYKNNLYTNIEDILTKLL